MRIFLLILLITGMLQADFFLLDGNRRIRMQEIKSGKIDFSSLALLPAVERRNTRLMAASNKEGFNHKHLNFRLASIDLLQENTSLNEYSTEALKAGEFTISFGDIRVSDGVMLQLFYHNHWYGVILGEPLKILHDLFSKTDLDPGPAYEQVRQARIAYPEDIRLILYEKKWKKAYHHSAESKKIDQIKQSYRLYQKDKQKFLSMQLASEIEAFEKEFPDSIFHKELLKIKKELQ